MKLDKKETNAKNFIEVAFKQHTGNWMKTANRLIDAFKGRYYQYGSRRNRFTVNSMFSIVNLMLPNLIFTQPYYRANPKHARYFKKLTDGSFVQIDNIRAAQTREAVINHKYTKIGAIYESRKALQDSFFYGFGITKTGYSYETIAERDIDYPIKDEPFIRRVNPKDFGWHPLATGISDSVHLVHRILTTKDELKKNDAFTGIDDLKSEIPQEFKKRFKNAQYVKDAGFITTYEVHDQMADKIFTYAGEEHKLIGKKDRGYDYSCDFNMIKLAGDNDTFEGIPLLGMVEDECHALNEAMTLCVEHMRKFPGMLWYNNGAIDEDDVERIRNGEQGSCHNVNDINQVRLENPLAMGGEYFNIINMLQNTIDRILGIPDFQRLTSTTRKSATEASYIQGDASVRREYYLQLVKDFMLGDVKKLDILVGQFQDETEEIQASGDLKGMTFKYDKTDLKLLQEAKVDAEDAEMMFDFDVEILKASNAEQLNMINNLLQIFAGNEVLHPVLKSFDPDKLGKMLFKKSGMNMEAVQYGSMDTTLFPSPEMENKAARHPNEFGPMPAPKKGEDLEYHSKVHEQDLRQNGPNEAILDHLAQTKLMMQELDTPPPPPQPQPNLLGSLGGMANQLGSMIGGGQGPQQKMSMT